MHRGRSIRNIILLGGGSSYSQKIKSLFGSSLIAYYPLSEATGATAYDISGSGFNGTYTGVDLVNAAAPAKIGGMAPYFDGANDGVNIFSAGFAAAHDDLEGTIIIWAKVSGAGDWTDGTDRRAIVIAVAGYACYTEIHKSSVNNTLVLGYKGTAETDDVSYDPISSTDWLMLALTWSNTADEVMAYSNGIQVEATLTPIGTWGASVSSLANIGSLSVIPSQVWKGWLCHAMILNRVATPAEILYAYNCGV